MAVDLEEPSTLINCGGVRAVPAPPHTYAAPRTIYLLLVSRSQTPIEKNERLGDAKG